MNSRIVETYPLSPMQRGMLFHSDYDHLAGFYIQQMVCTLREDLDVSALQKAWQQVIDRHPILRTAFRWDVDEPFQEVYEAFTIGFQEKDWRDQSDQEQSATVQTAAGLSQQLDRSQCPSSGVPSERHVAAPSSSKLCTELCTDLSAPSGTSEH